jgi:hypothetical protein
MCMKPGIALAFAIALLMMPPGALRAEDTSDVPTSIEIWIQLFPKGASNEAQAPRGAWTLFADDLRLTQAIDAEGGKSRILIGPQVKNGDFEDGGHQLNGYLTPSIQTLDATPEIPAASGLKFVEITADPRKQRHFPRGIKYYWSMPDLKQGRYFWPSVKARAKDADGIVAASLSVVFRAQNRQPTKAFHGPRIPVVTDRWIEVPLEFDYDRGIPKAVSERERLAGLDAERAKWPAYDNTPRPDDGRNLALSVAKWERRAGIPGRPFRVWAVGASWTGALASQNYWLVKAIRERFPNAPPIEFKSHTGSGCPWNYARG